MVHNSLYVKKNAVASRRFESWGALEAHLEGWTRETADGRRHGTTGETPRDRFVRDEAGALKPLGGRSAFITARDMIRRVGADCSVAVDGNACSVPWRLIGEQVRVTVSSDVVTVRHGSQEVARHAELKGRFSRAVDDAHLAGLMGTTERPAFKVEAAEQGGPSMPTLLRPLSEYEAVAGGRF